MVRLHGRRTEDAERAVALKLVHPAALGPNRIRHCGEERIECLDDLVRRKHFCERGRADEVDEHRGRGALLTLQSAALFEGKPRHVRTDVAAEQVGETMSLA